jgi:hypothetical protein
MKAVHLFAVALAVCAIASGCGRSPVGVDLPAISDTVHTAGAAPGNTLRWVPVQPVQPDGVEHNRAARIRNYAVAW